MAAFGRLLLSGKTVVRLQHKFLFVMNVLQAADHTVPVQTREGIEKLQASLDAVKERWEALR